MPDGLGRVRSVNDQPGFVQHERARPQWITRTASPAEQVPRILGIVGPRRPPVRLFKLVRNARQASPVQTFLRNPDPIAARGIVGIDEIEKAFLPIDHD